MVEAHHSQTINEDESESLLQVVGRIRRKTMTSPENQVRGSERES